MVDLVRGIAPATAAATMLLVSAEARVGRLAAIVIGALGVAVPDGEEDSITSDAALAAAADGTRGVEEDREEKPRLLAVARLLDDAPDDSRVMMGLVAMEGRSLTEAEATSSDERINKNGLAAAPETADSVGGIDDEGLQAEMGYACGCCGWCSSGTLPVVRDERR